MATDGQHQKRPQLGVVREPEAPAAPPQPSLANTAHNTAQAEKLFELLRQLIGQATLRGFYGRVALSFTVSDGTIQSVRDEMERQHR